MSPENAPTQCPDCGTEMQPEDTECKLCGWAPKEKGASTGDWVKEIEAIEKELDVSKKNCPACGLSIPTSAT